MKNKFTVDVSGALALLEQIGSEQVPLS